MRMEMKLIRKKNRLAAGIALALGAVLPVWAAPAVRAERVLLISLDGMHQQDLARCIATGTCPTLARLAGQGVEYSDARTPGLSDSFPGLAALLTGGTPKTTGIFYDVSYDRTLYAPSDLNCSGKTGWNMVLDETANRDGKDGAPLRNLDGGGELNPQALPRALVQGICQPVYPHNYIKTNTVFEAVKAQLPGARTAYADKHAWAYEWVNGPSGKGVDDLAHTEINSADPHGIAGNDYSKSLDGSSPAYLHTQTFDDLHVQWVIDQINRKDSRGKATASVPTLFGTNFQTLSVAQKTPNTQGGGYRDGAFTPGPHVAAAIQYLDHAVARMEAALKAQQLDTSTLWVITAKHGQAPADVRTLVRRGDTLTALLQSHHFLDAQGRFGQFKTKTGNPNDGSGLVGTGMVQTDDVGLIWLADQTQTDAAVAVLKQHLGCTGDGICADGPGAYILSGDALAAQFGRPEDGRAPDIIVQPNPGVIYTNSKKKDQEHGGNAPDDRHVALLLSMPGLRAAKVDSPVGLTQVAPTILQALGVSPQALQSVRAEQTLVLPGLSGISGFGN